MFLGGEKLKEKIKKNKEEFFEAGDIKLTCAVVFRGDIKLFERVLEIISQHGSIIYKRGSSINNRLYITEEETGDIQ